MDYLGWMNGGTDGQTASRQTDRPRGGPTHRRRTDGRMDRYTVHSNFVAVHCTVVCEKCRMRLRVLTAVTLKITIVWDLPTSQMNLPP